MTTLTLEAAVLFASLCGGQNVDPKFLAIIARQESSLRVEAVGPRNSDGTHDYGLTGINEKNFVFLNVDAASLIDQTEIKKGQYTVPRGACVAFRAQGDLLRILARYNTGRTGTPAGQAYAAGVLRVGNTKEVTHDFAQAAPITATDGARLTTTVANDPPAIYAKPAHAGRDLVYSTN